MFDIKKQDFAVAAEAGYEFELKLPTGAGSGAKLTVIGDMSKTVQAYARKKFQEYQQKQAIARRKGKDNDQIDLDEAEELAVEAALVRLVGWKGIFEDGVEVQFSKEKAAEVLKSAPWIREEIMRESADVLNFTPKIGKH